MTPYCKQCNRIKPFSEDKRVAKYIRIVVTRASPVYSQIGFINSLVKFKTDALEIVSNDLDHVVKWGRSSEWISRRAGLCGVHTVLSTNTGFTYSEYIWDKVDLGI